MTLSCASHLFVTVWLLSQYIPNNWEYNIRFPFLHGLLCLNLCFNRKLLPIPCSRPTLKIAIMLILAGDVSNSYLIRDYSTFESICVEIAYSSFSAYFVCSGTVSQLL